MKVGLAQNRDAVQTALAGHLAATTTLVDVDFTGFDTAELLAIQSQREQQARAQTLIDHRIQAALMAQAAPHEIGGKSWKDVLATRMRISGKEASRRVAAAAELGPRYAIGGEVLEPLLPACAAALQSGTINTEHITVIRDTVAKAEKYVSTAELAQIESDLVAAATRDTPETLKAAADKLLYLLNQDGDSPDIAAHLRGLRIGKQDADGLVHVQGWLDPETASYLTAVTGVWGAPGINNPDDPEPVHNPTPNPFDIPTPDAEVPDETGTDETAAEVPDETGPEPGDAKPTVAEVSDTEVSDAEAAPDASQYEQEQQAAADRDTRTQAQRNHDALKAALRELLMSKRLGQHGGLPVTVVVSTTLAELEAGAGIAVTGSGIRMPMNDLIRLASHSFHYLIIYEHHTAEPLYMARSHESPATTALQPGPRVHPPGLHRTCRPLPSPSRENRLAIRRQHRCPRPGTELRTRQPLGRTRLDHQHRPRHRSHPLASPAPDGHRTGQPQPLLPPRGTTRSPGTT